MVKAIQNLNSAPPRMLSHILPGTENVWRLKYGSEQEYLSDQITKVVMRGVGGPPKSCPSVFAEFLCRYCLGGLRVPTRFACQEFSFFFFHSCFFFWGIIRQPMNILHNPTFEETNAQSDVVHRSGG